MSAGSGRACVYTCLLGGYEALNEQAVAAASDLDFICFTDDATRVSESWRIVHVTPALALDPVRSQRIVKLSPHELLPDYDVSLYIDNSVILKVPPEEIIARYLPQDGRMAMPGHSFRASIHDEFLEIMQLGYDDSGRILEQLNHYQLMAPEVLAEVPYWSAVMLRRHHDPQVIAAMRVWLTHVLRYCRRDQVSGAFAFRAAGLHVDRFEVDNCESWFHRWPIAEKRDRAAFPFSPTITQLPAPILAADWLRTRDALHRRIAELEEALAIEHRKQQDKKQQDKAEAAYPVMKTRGEGPMAWIARTLGRRRRNPVG